MPFYTFKKIRLNRFFLYEDQTVHFDNQGLVVVKGINGAGKSLLFSSIPFLLYNSLPTGKSNRKEKSEISLSLKAKIKIEKEIPLSIKFAKSKYTIKRGNRNITPRRLPDSQNKIRSMFPSEPIFYSTCLISQFGSIFSSLIQGSPAVRAKVIEEFIDLSKIENIKEKVKEVEKKFTKDSSKLLSIREEWKSLKQSSEEIGKIGTRRIKSLLVKKDSLSLSIKKTSGKLAEEKALYKEYKKWKKIPKSLRPIKKPIAKQEIKKAKDRLSKLESLKDKIGTSNLLDLYLSSGKPKLYCTDIEFEDLPFPQKIERFPKESKLPKLFEVYNELKESLSFDRKNLKNLKKLLKKKKKRCPTCLHKLEERDTKLLISEIESAIEKAKLREKELWFVVVNANALICISQFFVENSIQKEDVKLYEKWRKYGIPQKIRELKAKLKMLEKQAFFASFIAEYGSKKPLSNNSSKISFLKNKLEKLENKREDLIENLVSLQVDLKRRKEIDYRLDELKTKYKKIGSRIKEDKIYLPITKKAIFSRDLKTEVLMEFCKFLVDHWNIYAPELFGRKNVRFNVGLERGFPAFKFSYGKGPSSDIRFMSGGEKKRLIVAMIPSILVVANSVSNLLALDEIDANMDEAGISAITDFLPTILESELGKNSIFFITPRKNFFHQEYQEWQIERSGNRSRLII